MLPRKPSRSPGQDGRHRKSANCSKCLSSTSVTAAGREAAGAAVSAAGRVTFGGEGGVAGGSPPSEFDAVSKEERQRLVLPGRGILSGGLAEHGEAWGLGGTRAQMLPLSLRAHCARSPLRTQEVDFSEEKDQKETKGNRLGSVKLTHVPYQPHPGRSTSATSPTELAPPGNTLCV